MSAYLSLSRAWNSFFAACVCTYSFFIAKRSLSYDCDEVLLSIGIFFLVAFANAHNDIADYEIDNINRPNRPLPSGKISLRAAYIATFAWLFIAMIFGALADLKFGFFFSIVATLCFAYNRFLKGMPLAGNLMVALLICFPVIMPIIKFGLPQPELLNLAFFAFMLTLAREITKDIEDIDGDKAGGLKTFSVLFGVNASLRLVFVCELLCLVQIAIFAPFLLVSVVPFLAASVVFAVLKRWRLSQTMIKIAMIAGMALLFYILA